MGFPKDAPMIPLEAPAKTEVKGFWSVGERPTRRFVDLRKGS